MRGGESIAIASGVEHRNHSRATWCGSGRGDSTCRRWTPPRTHCSVAMTSLPTLAAEKGCRGHRGGSVCAAQRVRCSGVACERFAPGGAWPRLGRGRLEATRFASRRMASCPKWFAPSSGRWSKSGVASGLPTGHANSCWRPIEDWDHRPHRLMASCCGESGTTMTSRNLTRMGQCRTTRSRESERSVERRTYSAKPGDVQRDWYIVDAENMTLGRLATAIAATLRGKNKAQFTPHIDTGDFVIVINAAKVRVTGNKEREKFYYRHSGYPGGLTATALRDVRARHPERIIESAVRGMLPHNILGNQQFKKMKVYAGSNHPHAAQNPKPLPVDYTADRPRL